jgi:alkaline phosphatase
MKMKNLKLAVLFLLVITSCLTAKQNVILMISDGQGFNSLNAANMYLGYNTIEKLGFPVKIAMQTHSASGANAFYNPSEMWKNIQWAKTNHTDSAAAATAMYTGVKVFNGSINWSTAGTAIPSIFDLASERGYATGAITTVEFSHATPGACGAHVTERGSFSDIANEMIFKSGLDVIMGAGNPFYDNDGKAKNEGDYQYVGGKTTWEKLKEGKANGFKLIESKADFQQLADGNVTSVKILGLVQAAATTQEARSEGKDFNVNVPSLAVMAKGALNVLNKDPNGFCIMIEGGAIDWANHGNNEERMIEEETDFLKAVEEVHHWIEKNSSWKDTLLIVTADHECGFITGDVNSLTDIESNGPNKLPKMAYNAKKHSNSLVPLFAKGKNAEMFNYYVIGCDNVGSDKYFGINSRNYIDNTTIFTVMNFTLAKTVCENQN